MKYCPKCKLNKCLSEFYSRKKGPRTGEHYEKCKECMKIRGRNYYHQNRDRQLSLALVRRHKAYKVKRDFINKVKAQPCVDCGKSYPPFVMDFDNIDPYKKVTDIGYMSSRNWSLENIQKEINKCEVVCANCHRIRTYGKRFAEVAKVVTAEL